MKRMDVVKDGDEWVAKSGGRTVPGTRAALKVDAVRQTAEAAKSHRDAVSVKIHLARGPIQEERTYPRGADPRKSKG